jgi:endonuclease YncB( thermonuclease family)
MTRYLLIIVWAVALGMTVPDAQSAGTVNKPVGQRAAQSSKPAKAKAPAKESVRKAPKSATRSKKRQSGKAGAAKASGSGVARESQNLPPSAPAGTSAAVPITTPGGDFAVPVIPSRPTKPIMNRMYALDGDTFYHNGKKIRVRGLEAVHDSDVAMQRLQRALDSGEVAVEPIVTRETGEVEATVRVHGRDLTEILLVDAPDAVPAGDQGAEPPTTEATPATPAPKDAARP